jgi:uncharacterized RDD family membrane protein YckC
MTDMRSGAGGVAPASAATPAQAAAIAGFWRRIFAFLIDSIILGAVGYAIIQLNFDRLLEMGPETRLIGFPISLAYFAFLDSRYGGGASLGKRMLGLRVTGRIGRRIGLLRALLRTIVFTLPWYLNGLDLSFLPLHGLPENAVLAADTFIVFGGELAIAYLYLFNTRTRQSLHDLAVGSFVVRAEPAGARVGGRIWFGHLAVITLPIAAVAAGLVVAGPQLEAWLATTALFKSGASLETLIARVGREPEVGTVGVQLNTFEGPEVSTTTLIVTVALRKRVPDAEAEADRIAGIVLDTDPNLLGEENLSVVVAYSVDVGIWRQSYARNFVYARAEWLKRLHRSGTKDV